MPLQHLQDKGNTWESAHYKKVFIRWQVHSCNTIPSSQGHTHQLVPEGSRSNPSSGLHLGPEEFQNHSYQVTLAISCSGSPPKLALRYDHEQVALGLSAKGGTDLGPAGFLAREGLLGGSWVV